MKLMTSGASPFARKVRVMIAEAGLSDRIEEVEVTTTPVGPSRDLIAVNPLGKIPALVRDDGPTLFDSRVITRYIDTLAGGRFYPEARLWDILTLEATADGMLDAAVLMVYETRFRDEDKRSSQWVDGQWAKVARALDAIEARWMSSLAGEIDAGKIAVGCVLGYLDLRHGARDWRAGRPGLAA
ncbi:MAG: glutathione S-transferase family protein, partial [Rhodobacteraceae bacterium]